MISLEVSDRLHFEERGLTEEWWREYSALSKYQKELINPIIYSNKFDDYDNNINDEQCLKVLSYYRIKREDAEMIINAERSKQ